MTINAIIAEYNPFHNGHRYQLQQARIAKRADYTIVVMSGNFVQRGAPAIVDKFTRAHMALSNGADLVLELPVFYAASSAEYFATGAVSLLDKLGVVDNLCFGSECGDVDILWQIADILLSEPTLYTDSLRQSLSRGNSFPSARTSALLEYCPSLSASRDILSSPNNILGIEYIKALHRLASSIQPYTILRVGSDYHEQRMTSYQCSALAIRQAIFSRQDYSFLQPHMPDNSFQLLTEALNNRRPVHINDFSQALLYKLVTEQGNGFCQYLDVTKDLSDRICRQLDSYYNFRGFCEQLKSKELTYTRISRSLLHILLDMKKETYEEYRSLDYIPYARVLGLRQSASSLFTALKQNSRIPLITKLADAQKLLPETAWKLLEKELVINRIYESTAAVKSQQPLQNEYRIPLVIV